MGKPSPTRLLPSGLVLLHCLTVSLCWQGGQWSPRRALQHKSTVAGAFHRTSLRQRSSHRSDDSGDTNGIQNIPMQTQSPLASHIMKDAGLDEEESSLEFVQGLQEENDRLRDSLRESEVENERLQLEVSSRIILETFEGERRLKRSLSSSQGSGESSFASEGSLTLTGEEMLTGEPSLWCDKLEEDACPVEPTISFGEALRDRAYWLVGLLVMQSGSGIILARNEALLANHPVIIYFLTMLVGAGGNAGNQASVRVIRGLALGTLNDSTQMQFLTREFKMAVALSIILSIAGFIRAIAFRTPLPETIAVTTALSMIVFISVCLGAVLPLGLRRIGVDPAHSSTSIQVIMDILGVVLAVVVSSLLLDSPVGTMLISNLTGASA